jgi:hypothetical protein
MLLSCQKEDKTYRVRSKSEMFRKSVALLLTDILRLEYHIFLAAAGKIPMT